MLQRVQRRVTFSNVISVLALFVALGGVSYAAVTLPAKSVGTKQLKKNAVTLAKIAPAARTALKGQTGPTGATGATGAMGAPGPGTVRWALINGAGTIIAQSGGITVTREFVGNYIFGFGASVAGKAIMVTPNDAFTSTSRIDVMAGPCGTNSAAGETDCGSTALNDGQHVWTSAADSFALASGNQDEGFYLALIG